jgi:hypothetical protein
MPFKTKIYFVLSAIAPPGVFFILYGLATSQLLLAWIATIIVILCMRGRVQFGDRVPHQTLFWIHLSSSIIFLAWISYLTFISRSVQADLAALAFFAIPLSTGAILWWRGVRAILKINR